MNLPMASSIAAKIHFLKRKALYKEETPYTLRFVPEDETCPLSNIENEPKEVTIQDLRYAKDMSFEIHGITLLEFESALSYDDFADRQKVEDTYLEELRCNVKRFLGASRVLVIPHLIETETPGTKDRFALYKIRRRHADFPVSTGQAYQWEQPTSIANIGKFEVRAKAMRALS